MLDLGLSNTSRATVLTIRVTVLPPYPPPPGYRWDAVVESGTTLHENNQSVIELTRIAA